MENRRKPEENICVDCVEKIVNYYSNSEDQVILKSLVTENLEKHLALSGQTMFNPTLHWLFLIISFK